LIFLHTTLDRVEPVALRAANLRKIEIAAVGQQAFDLHEVSALVDAAEADFAVEFEPVGGAGKLVFIVVAETGEKMDLASLEVETER
jgi:hypothetical protein